MLQRAGEWLGLSDRAFAGGWSGGLRLRAFWSSGVWRREVERARVDGTSGCARPRSQQHRVRGLRRHPGLRALPSGLRRQMARDADAQHDARRPLDARAPDVKRPVRRHRRSTSARTPARRSRSGGRRALRSTIASPESASGTAGRIVSRASSAGTTARTTPEARVRSRGEGRLRPRSASDG